MDLIHEFGTLIDVFNREGVAYAVCGGWEGRVVSIVSREGLGLMKSLAGRDQDLTDLKQLGIDKHE